MSALTPGADPQKQLMKAGTAVAESVATTRALTPLVEESLLDACHQN